MQKISIIGKDYQAAEHIRGYVSEQIELVDAMGERVQTFGLQVWFLAEHLVNTPLIRS